MTMCLSAVAACLRQKRNRGSVCSILLRLLVMHQPVEPCLTKPFAPQTAHQLDGQVHEATPIHNPVDPRLQHGKTHQPVSASTHLSYGGRLNSFSGHFGCPPVERPSQSLFASSRRVSLHNARAMGGPRVRNAIRIVVRRNVSLMQVASMHFRELANRVLMGRVTRCQHQRMALAQFCILLRLDIKLPLEI